MMMMMIGSHALTDDDNYDGDNYDDDDNNYIDDNNHDDFDDDDDARSHAFPDGDKVDGANKGSNKKKREKSGQADRLGRPPTPPPPPPKRSGKCKNFSTSCHIWGYFAIL